MLELRSHTDAVTCPCEVLTANQIRQHHNYSCCQDTMQNTQFVDAIFLWALTTAIMGVKLPNLSFDIIITHIFSVYLHLSVVQIIILLHCMHQTHEFFLCGHLEINGFIEVPHLFATWTMMYVGIDNCVILHTSLSSIIYGK